MPISTIRNEYGLAYFKLVLNQETGTCTYRTVLNCKVRRNKKFHAIIPATCNRPKPSYRYKMCAYDYIERGVAPLGTGGATPFRRLVATKETWFGGTEPPPRLLHTDTDPQPAAEPRVRVADAFPTGSYRPPKRR